MLPFATLGMIGYGLYSLGTGLTHAFGSSPLELWASLGLMVFGAI